MQGEKLMYCSSCGAENKDAANFCCSCGRPLVDPLPAPDAGFHSPYAGFWKRFAAYIIDELVLSALALVLFILVGGMIGISLSISGFKNEVIGPVTIVYFILIEFFLNWLYFTLMESSSKQATPGKIVLGIVVSDIRGHRVSFARANARFFLKFLSGLLFNIGYIIAGFTERKQALHDLIADTLVVNENR
jgi:uncharacterized RDD family membrane protein YckC